MLFIATGRDVATYANDRRYRLIAYYDRLSAEERTTLDSLIAKLDRMTTPAKSAFLAHNRAAVNLISRETNVLPSSPHPRGVSDYASNANNRTVHSTCLELIDFTHTQLDTARNTPAGMRSGLLSVLIDAIDAKVLDVGEACNLLLVLFNAGTETTSSLIAEHRRDACPRPRLARRAAP